MDQDIYLARQWRWDQPLADARILTLTFENFTLAGKPVLDSTFFKTNEFVDGLIFKP